MALTELAATSAPINEFIVKVASRCNLDCDYCYEYNTGDESWRKMPKFMSQDTCGYLALRIAEHAQEHRLEKVFITFHGGEPTLAGPRRLANYCESFTAASAGAFTVEFAMQTNATLVDCELCELICSRNIQISASLDGGPQANDLHRLGHSGKSSYKAAAEGIKRLKENCGSLLTGLLAVVDVRTDPVQVFDELAAFGLNAIDFLLPHHNWSRPPLRPGNNEIAYGEWYFELFKAWVGGRHPNVNIRFFVNILSQLVGRGGIYEAMNLSPTTLVTVNTVGDYEAVDCIKSTGTGAQTIDRSVKHDTVSSLLQHPAIAIRQSGIHQLSDTCRACKHQNTCAGGYYPHRYSSTRGFDNPSIYCNDLYWLIDAISAHIRLESKRA